MTPLSTTELDRILGQNSVTKGTFLGTYPACIFPKTKKKLYAVITNTHEHDRAGQHWNSWVVRGDKVSFFDSFGRSPDDETLPEHYRDIVKMFKHVAYTTDRVQGWDSIACGYFCVHFIYMLSLGLDYNTFLDEYTNEFETNDDIVYKFYKLIR